MLGVVQRQHRPYPFIFSAHVRTAVFMSRVHVCPPRLPQPPATRHHVYVSHDTTQAARV